MKTALVYASIAFLVVVGGAALLLFTPSGKRPLTAIFAVGEVERIDFATFKRTDEPNQFLMCPPGFCDANPPMGSPTLTA